MTVQSERPYTMSTVAEMTGVPLRQLQHAVTRGELKPAGKFGKAFTFTDEEVETIKRAAGLVSIGVGLWLAIRAVREGWAPPETPLPSR